MRQTWCSWRHCDRLLSCDWTRRHWHGTHLLLHASWPSLAHLCHLLSSGHSRHHSCTPATLSNNHTPTAFASVTWHHATRSLKQILTSCTWSLRKVGRGKPFRSGVSLVYEYTVSQKKLCQLIFGSLSVKYEPISIKIGRIVPEETLNETVPKLPTSPKVCACTTLGNLKCQIDLSTQ